MDMTSKKKLGGVVVDRIADRAGLTVRVKDNIWGFKPMIFIATELENIVRIVKRMWEAPPDT